VRERFTDKEASSERLSVDRGFDWRRNEIREMNGNFIKTNDTCMIEEQEAKLSLG